MTLPVRVWYGDRMAYKIAQTVLIIVFTSLPITWMFMLALGNFGYAQYGFADVFPLAAGLVMVMPKGDS